MSDKATPQAIQNILSATVRDLSEETRKSPHRGDGFRDPLLEKIIQDRIISAASKFLHSNLQFSPSVQYQTVPSKKCDLVLSDIETKENIMWWEIKILKRRDATQSFTGKRLQTTGGRKSIYPDLIRLSWYTPPEEEKYCLVASFLIPKQLEDEGRVGAPPHRELAKLFTSKFDEINLRIPFVGVDSEVGSVIEAMKKALLPVCNAKEIAALGGLRFKLQRTFAEYGRENENNYAALYLFKIIDFRYL